MSLGRRLILSLLAWTKSNQGVAGRLMARAGTTSSTSLGRCEGFSGIGTDRKKHAPEALNFLVHFVVYLHLPLDCGDRYRHWWHCHRGFVAGITFAITSHRGLDQSPMSLAGTC